MRELFGKFGDIKSVAVMSKEDKDGNKKSFAFVCYDRQGEPQYGPQCAHNAVVDLHEKELDGFKIYV